MRKRLVGIVMATVGGVVLSAVPAGSASAWDNAANLKVGDTVCTGQTSAANVRLYGSILNGAGTASIRVATSVGGPETVVWSTTGSNGTNLHFDKKLTATAPGQFFRGCVGITAQTINTWTKFGLLINTTESEVGQRTATLAPGSRYCGDNGMGPVRMRGTASASVTWTINAFDNDYGFVGTVFSVGGASVDQVFTPGPDLSLLEMCVINTSNQTITASFDLSQAT